MLSKAEEAGLLSLAEKNGLTLTFIERSGLLSKAEALGLLSAATDRCWAMCAWLKTTPCIPDRLNVAPYELECSVHL